jgi:hypothetical protein
MIIVLVVTVGLVKWRGHCEYKHGKILQDDRCRTKIDGETTARRAGKARGSFQAW